MTEPDPVAASRAAFGWQDEPDELPEQWASPAALNLFLFAVCWLALVGLVTVLRWLAEGAMLLGRGAGV